MIPFLSSVGPIGTAVCVYGASPGVEGGIYEVFAQDVLDYTQDPPVVIVNDFFKCDASNPRSDTEARLQVESEADVSQIGENPILVLDSVT